jgi:hypothetical protein
VAYARAFHFDMNLMSKLFKAQEKYRLSRFLPKRKQTTGYQKDPMVFVRDRPMSVGVATQSVPTTTTARAMRKSEADARRDVFLHYDGVYYFCER